MRALLQRVLEAKVVVDGETTGEIQHGILVFLGLGKEDTLDKGKKLIDKILKYRFFIMVFKIYYFPLRFQKVCVVTSKFVAVY